jgi:hypothetical protein
LAVGAKSILAGYLAVAAAGAGGVDLSQEKGFHAAVGAEYQYISQRYYKAVLDTISMDIIETWYLDREDIDDFIARTSFSYGFQNRDRRANLLTDIEISEDRFLSRSEGFYQLRNHDNIIKLFGKFEAKSPYDEDNNRITGYTYCQTYLDGNLKASEKIRLNAKTGGEMVNFSKRHAGGVDDTVSGLPIRFFPLYDYNLFACQVGGDFSVSEFTSGFLWRASYTRRNVPDSGAADYHQYRFSLEYLYTSLNGFADLSGEIERRDYAQPWGTDDFTAYAFDGRLSRTLNPKIEAATYIHLDIYDFSQPDLVDRNHRLFSGELKGIHKIGNFNWGPLTRLEYRHEKALADSELGSYSESYSQWAAGFHVDFMNLKSLFLNSEATIGRRQYEEAAGAISSYDYISLSLLVNYWLSKNISIQAMVDSDLERHAKEEDNSSLYLLTVGLNARL